MTPPETNPPRPSLPSLDEDRFDTLVLGIGNLLWADEGFGVRCAEAMAAAWEVPPRVRIVDGGTQGLYLLPYVQQAERLLVFDAIDYGLPAGTLRIIEDDEVPRFMGAKKMSLHQTGFQDVIAAAGLTGKCPRQMVLIGVQPVELEDYGGSLRPAVKERIPQAVAIAVDRLRRWGIELSPRAAGGAEAGITDAALSMEGYEAGRPSAEMACRVGDARFFAERGAERGIDTEPPEHGQGQGAR